MSIQKESNPVVPEILMHVVAHAAQIHGKNIDLEQRKVELQALDRQLDYQYSRDELKASMAKELIHSLIDGRIAVIQDGFKQTLAIFIAQGEHYMAQQSKLEDAKILSNNLTLRIQYDARILEIDVQLAEIRSQARALYRDMAQMILLIGGTMPPLGGDFQRVLLLP